MKKEILSYNAVVEWADGKGLNTDTPENWKEARAAMAKELGILTPADQKKLKSFKAFPESFLQELKPVGKAKFKGDIMPAGWSINDKLTKGKEYFIYDMEGLFVVGDAGDDAYKIVQTAWGKIKWIH